MTRRDVLVMFPPRPKAMAQLEEIYSLHRYDTAADKDAFLTDVGPRCEAVVTNGHEPLTRDHLRHMPNVGLVACSSAGFEDIDDAARTLVADGAEVLWIGADNTVHAAADVVIAAAKDGGKEAGKDAGKAAAPAKDGDKPAAKESSRPAPSADAAGAEATAD